MDRDAIYLVLNPAEFVYYMFWITVYFRYFFLDITVRRVKEYYIFESSKQIEL